MNIASHRQATIEKARLFAIVAHAGQVRKFSGLPYHSHPQAVVRILLEHVPNATWEMICAAYLHDVIEDTGAGHLIEPEFGSVVTGYVHGLTNVKVDGLNRAAQKTHDAQRIAWACREVKQIKLCDRYHNLPDIIANDPKHALVYVPETRHLLDHALKGVCDPLWNKLDAIVKKYYEDSLALAA